MSGAFVMKAGDTLPAIEDTLLLPSGDPVDLSGGAAVALRVGYVTQGLRFAPDVAMYRASVGDPLIAVLAHAGHVVAPSTAGKVRFNWTDLAPTALLGAGTYLAEWVVTFSDTTLLTFPNDGYFTILVLPHVA